jgi:hypothetical protein
VRSAGAEVRRGAEEQAWHGGEAADSEHRTPSAKSG